MSNSRYQALCGEDYCVPAEQLPPSRAPRWMWFGLLATVLALVTVLLMALFGPMDESVPAGGIIRPADQRLVHSETEAVLEKLHVRPGDRVQEGALLATLDPWEADKRVVELEQRLAEARADLRLAEATRAKIEAVPVPTEFFFGPVETERLKEIAEMRRQNAERTEKLHEQGAASMLDLLNQRILLAETEGALRRNEKAALLANGSYGEAAKREAAERVASAGARVKALDTALQMAKKERERCDVRAPRAGRVLSVTSRLPGERLAVGTPLARLAVTDQQELRLYATEDRLPAVKPGQIVRFQPRKSADKLARPSLAEVTEVAIDRDLSEEPAKRTNGEIALTTYRITARVVNSTQPMPVGAEVDAEIVIQRQPFWRHMLTKLGARH